MDLLYQLNNYLKCMGIDYAVCGGSAIDLFVGCKTRSHKDLDVAVFWEDRDIIIQYMLSAGWHVFEPFGCEHLHKIRSVEIQKRIKSNIWCVKPDSRHYVIEEHEKDMFAVEHDGSEQVELDFIEFLFNNREDGYFLYTRNQSIKRKIDDAVLSFDNIFYLAPEIVLLYKSTAVNNADYQLDFDNTLPLLDSNRRIWLVDALKCMFPDGHVWLDKLETR